MNVGSDIVSGLSFSKKNVDFLSQNEIEVNYFFEKGIEIICKYSLNNQNYIFTFFYSKNYLARYEQSFHQPFSLLSSSTKIYENENIVCCKLSTVFENLTNNHLEGMMNAIFIESQALLILLHTHTTCEKIERLPCYNCKFLNIPSEKQKILQARVLLLINISEPMSIPQLAKAVHINDCYLKKGFKEMFGFSIFDFVKQEKIKKAKYLLQQNKCSINHIAFELGYSNTSNFTNAFKKNTGYTPTEWQNNNFAIKTIEADLA